VNCGLLTLRTAAGFLKFRVPTVSQAAISRNAAMKLYLFTDQR